MSDYHVIVEYDHSADELVASSVMQTLIGAYPGHPWHVRVGSGVIAVKHLRISSKWAELRHYAKHVNDAKKLKHEILMVGGVLLERASMRRGADTGERPAHVEGVPDKDRAH